MAVNNIRVEIVNQGGIDLQIPIEQIWDFQGQQQAIETYEASIIEQILNKDEDFEVTRFEHMEYDTNKSSLNYEFYLWDSVSSPSGSYENSSAYVCALNAKSNLLFSTTIHQVILEVGFIHDSFQ